MSAEVEMNPEKVEFLRVRGAYLTEEDVEAVEKRKKRRLESMVKQGLLKRAQEVDEKGVRLDDRQMTELFTAVIRRSDLETAQWLVDREPRLGKKKFEQKNELLVETIVRDDLETVQWLESKGANVESPNQLLEELMSYFRSCRGFR